MIHPHSVACFVFLVATAASFPLPHNNWWQTATRSTSYAPATVRGALRKRVTLDLCTKSKECEGARKCLEVLGDPGDPNFQFPCTARASSCVCLPKKLQECKKDADCDNSREICIQLQSGIGSFFCAAQVVRTSASVKTVAPKPKDEKRRNSAAGKTLQICSEDSECKGNRKCSSAKKDFIDNPKACTNALRKKYQCFCLPDEIQTCALNADCEAGEVCGRLEWLEAKNVICVSADMEPWNDITSVSDDDPRRTTKPNPSKAPEPSANPTPSLDEASNPGQDVVVEVTVTSIPEPSPDTIAIPSETETMEMTPSDGPDGGVVPTSQPETVSASPEAVSGSTESISASPESVLASPESVLAPPEGETESEAPSETEDPVCVDAGALSHLGADELVFRKHSTARVLCDSQGSCATEGHMVVFKSRAMMMRSYCLVAKCSERTIEVNSPKYRRGLRIPSKTEGLHFTSFAARYSTKVEEMAIHVAIRAGL